MTIYRGKMLDSYKNGQKNKKENIILRRKKMSIELCKAGHLKMMGIAGSKMGCRSKSHNVAQNFISPK